MGKPELIRIYADFNEGDKEDRVCLDTVGSLKDIEKYKAFLKDGLEVILYEASEFEVHGKLLFDENIWKAIPDWSTVRDYGQPSAEAKREGGAMSGKTAVHVEVTNIFLGGSASLGKTIQGSPAAVIEELKKLVETVTAGVKKLSVSEYCKLHNFAFAQETDDPVVTLKIMSGFYGGQHWISIKKVRWSDGSETDFLW
jgi:hypothetical protein